MPQPYKGRRMALTVRLPVDVYTEAARRARHRQWSLSHFVAYAVANEVARGTRTSGPKVGRNAGWPTRVEAESAP